MSVHLQAMATRRRMCRVSGGAGALAVLLATALAMPAAAATAPASGISPNQQSVVASELPAPPIAAGGLPSAGSLSDPEAGEGVETTPDGQPTVPDDNSVGAADDNAQTVVYAATAGDKVLRHGYEVQKTGYWCSAAAARIALTARGKAVSQAELASYMHVTRNGLPNIGNLRDALNHYTGSRYYQVKQWPNNDALKSKLTADVRYDIDRGRAVVINVVRIGTAHFPGGHYATIVGYRNGGAQFAIADPARAKRQLIWLSADDVVGGIKLHRYVA